MKNQIVYSNLYELIDKDEIEYYVYKHLGGFEDNLAEICNYYSDDNKDIPELTLAFRTNTYRNGRLDLVYKVLKPKLKNELDKWVFIETYDFDEAYDCFEKELEKYGVKIEAEEKIYLVALATGGEMGGNPEIIYTDYRRVKAINRGKAIEKYNKQMNCSYYYGECLGQLDKDGNLIKKINYSELELLD